jgi:RNA polymerase sigma-70 factor (ECF subfamily)
MNQEKRVEEFSLEALRASNKAEFARLVEAYSGVIYRLALKVVEDPQDAEDVLQETFIKAYRALPNFDGRSSLSTWLYRIATNEALMTLRRRKSASVANTISIEEPSPNEENEQEPIQIVDWCCLPETEMMSTEARAYMEKAIETLSPALRTVFLLRDIEGLSTQETAEVLNVSEVVVKTRLSRARMRLRELLSEYFGERAARRSTPEGENS